MSIKIKKSFAPIIAILATAAEAGKTVADILEEVTTLASTKGRATSGAGSVSTFIKDAEGATVAVLDYYFKRWMPIVGDEAVEFGAKASAASGLNSMSKAGTGLWTKQQKLAKDAMSNILVQVEAGDMEVSEIGAAKESIEAERKFVADTTDGFETRDEVVAYLEESGFDLTPAAAEEEVAES